jgi:hypothetical protein
MNIPHWTVRIAGSVMIVLGLLIWTGSLDGLIPIHMLVGIVLVVALWVLSWQAYRVGVTRGLVWSALVIGLILPIVGIAQKDVLHADDNVIVPIVHLGLGLLAIGLGEALTAAMQRRSSDGALAA